MLNKFLFNYYIQSAEESYEAVSHDEVRVVEIAAGGALKGVQRQDEEDDVSKCEN